MTTDRWIAVISICMSTVIGIWQIFASKSNSMTRREIELLKVKIDKMEMNVSSNTGRGITGNSNAGDISNNIIQ